MDTNEQPPVQSEQHMSRRERRELRRQGQHQQQGRQQRGRIARRVAIWGVGIAVVVALGWLTFRAASNVKLPTPGGNLTVPVSADDHSRGPATAPVTLVEYSDFQCPACGAYEPLVRKLLAEPALKDNVRLVYRHFPLTHIHQNAQLAALASEAAAAQGKFWEFHDKLFDNQSKWAAMSAKGARDAFIGYARDLGLDDERFTKDLDGGAGAARVKADTDGGLAAGVDATPTFFVNGARMAQPNSYDEFRNFVVNALHTRP